MSKPRKENRSPGLAIVAMALCLLTLLGAYPASYFALATNHRDSLGAPVKLFPNEAIAKFYRPAVWLESNLTDVNYAIGWIAR